MAAIRISSGHGGTHPNAYDTPRGASRHRRLDVGQPGGDREVREGARHRPHRHEDRGAMAQMLVGSVAEKVVRRAPCPVLTVRHPEHEFIVPDAADTTAHQD
jgi:hypothetical protein